MLFAAYEKDEVDYLLNPIEEAVLWTGFFGSI